MTRACFIVGPTASGKSELAADVAREIGAEIVSADAFQIYRGLNLLTAKPGASTLAQAPHYLIGTVPLIEEMNAEKYRRAAMRAIEEINSRGNLATIVGGSGLYIKAVTHGLAPLPDSNSKIRARLNAMNLGDLCSQLAELDPETSQRIDLKNRRRVVRALEISLLTGRPASEALAGRNLSAEALAKADDTGKLASPILATRVFVLRDRNELYERINQRTEMMCECCLIEKINAARRTSATA